MGGLNSVKRRARPRARVSVILHAQRQSHQISIHRCSRFSLHRQPHSAPRRQVGSHYNHDAEFYSVQTNRYRDAAQVEVCQYMMRIIDAL